MLVFFAFCVYIPKDPGYIHQFYLNNTGQYLGISQEDISVRYAWNQGFFGQNINVSIIDDGCYYDHIDLRRSYNPELSWSVITDSEYVFRNGTGVSGTINAGIVAADGNTYCTIGVSKEARFGIIEVDKDNYSSVAQGISKFNDFSQIKLVGSIKSNQDYCNYEFSSDIDEAISRVPDRVSIIAPAGSESFQGGDPNFSPITRNPRVIVVSDSNNRGARGAWTNRGTSISVSAPIGGSSSYIDFLLPSTPGLGTSHQEDMIDNIDPRNKGAAVIAGIAAFILQAHPSFLSRDISAVLSLSAVITDPQHPSWKKNAAGIWYSHLYGFGRVDSGAALHFARQWSVLPEQVRVNISVNSNKNIPSLRSGSIDEFFEFQNAVSSIEYIVLCFNMKTVDFSTLRILVYSPMGTLAQVKAPSKSQSGSTNSEYSFTIRNFMGESSGGTWKIHFVSDGVLDGNHINEITLDIYGVSSSDRFQSYQQIGTLPYEKRVTEPQISVSIDKTVINCDSDIRVRIEYPEDIYVSLFISDQNRTARWPIISRPTPISNIEKLNIPCFFSNASLFYLIAENSTLSLQGETQVLLFNMRQTGIILTPSAYEVFRFNDENFIEFKVMPVLNLSYWIDGGFAQRIRIQIYDIVNHSVLYINDMSILEYPTIRYSGPKCRKCLLSLAPNWFLPINDCMNLIQPISIIGKFDDPPSPFNIDLNDYCPPVPGIFTPTPVPQTPNPTNSPTFLPTSTPTETYPGENMKHSTRAIIAGTLYIIVFAISVILFFYINRSTTQEKDNQYEGLI